MGRLLDNIKTPDDLKRLSVPELTELAAEIRERIISVVSATGGHLAPSLGAVELAIAIHYVFDSPKDKIIWDVGHQAYAHKILTGRNESFSSLRQEGGLSGFPKPSESEHDAFGTGHGSTSISAALGMSCARDIRGENYRVVAVIGDGSLTGGLSFEGLNQAGGLGKRLIVIINDNKMSISPNVGALAKYMTKLISAPGYRRFEADLWELLGRMPSGGRARYLAGRITESLKGLLLPGTIFEELGFKYYGPIDGHNISDLIAVLTQLKEVKIPVMLHTLTVKGKGYKRAEENSSLYHGVGAFDKITGEAEKKTKYPTYTDVFGSAIVEIGAQFKDVTVITAAMKDNTGLAGFADRFPERFFDVGMAEGHAVTFAAGLASRGALPVVAIYSTFLQRAFDHIVHDVALQNLKVVFVVDRAGVVGEDGPTHHGCLDLAYLRAVPGLTVMAPKDEGELRNMLFTAVKACPGPAAIRFPRSEGVGSDATLAFSELRGGRAECVREGEDVVLCAIGSMVYPCLEAAEMLSEKGIKAGVVNARFAKPVDDELICRLARKSGKLVTVEEGSLAGGFGSAVLECLEANGVCASVKRLGIPDAFIEHASRGALLEKLGLTARGIAKATLSFLGASELK
ncbi:MAG: 1-deoxy-D-xylulose-5-phosphate synthase [Candidatus Eisenbacteria bacterium]|nr:1-deoxy-D-xylulose-5-phosphate synthase [Candidatus Eisenbacteria bacterium]